MTDAVQVENSSLDLPLTGCFFDFGNILFFHILDATVGGGGVLVLVEKAFWWSEPFNGSRGRFGVGGVLV